jgi:hypothetical protein
VKKRTKKLALSRETLRALADPPLREAAGGATAHCGSDPRSFCDICLSVASQCPSFCPAQC